MKISVKNLNKKFRHITILKNINVEFENGKIYGLYGRNGSGKSVFLKVLCGLYLPTSGEVLFDGKNYNNDNMYIPNTRALIERPSFFPELTGYNNLKILADIQKKIGKKEIEETLALVNLLNEKDKKYSQYSLGMKQKLGIASVLMENPEIIILDEPFNGIDSSSVKKISEYLKTQKQLGKLIILSTHIIEDLKYLCDEVYSFDDGEVKSLDIGNVQ